LFVCSFCRCKTFDWTSFRRFMCAVGHETLVSFCLMLIVIRGLKVFTIWMFF
jgi:hypothetical protein